MFSCWKICLTFPQAFVWRLIFPFLQWLKHIVLGECMSGTETTQPASMLNQNLSSSLQKIFPSNCKSLPLASESNTPPPPRDFYVLLFILARGGEWTHATSALLRFPPDAHARLGENYFLPGLRRQEVLRDGNSPRVITERSGVALSLFSHQHVHLGVHRQRSKYSKARWFGMGGDSCTGSK